MYRPGNVRKIVLVLFCALLSIVSFAQEGINYQAIARNATGSPLKNASVSVTFIVHDGSAAGPNIFNETHPGVSTNNFGLVNLVIGTVNAAAFQAIDWAANSRWLEVRIDGTPVGTEELHYVPYALEAKNSRQLIGIGVSSVSAGQALVYDGTNFVGADTANWFPSAGNGLSLNGTSIEMGGELTGNTQIDHAGNNLEWVVQGGAVKHQITVGSGTGSFSVEDGSAGVILSAWKDGRVGIGATTPSAQLHLQSTTTTAVPQFLIEQTSTGDASMKFSAGGDIYTMGIDNSLSDAFRISHNDGLGASDFFTVEAAGDIGIGLTNPTVKFHVWESTASTTPTMHLDQDGTGDAGLQFSVAAQTITMGIDNSDADKFKIADGTNVASGTRLTMDATGNFGIGVTAPTQKLEVSGNVFLNDGYFISESATGINSEHFSLHHVGGPAANNIEWRHSIRSNNEDYWIYGYDGTTFKNMIKFDWSSSQTLFNQGYVGIGSSLTSASDWLDISGGGSGGLVINGFENTGTVGVTIRSAASDGTFDFYGAAGIALLNSPDGTVGSDNDFRIYNDGFDGKLKFSYNNGDFVVGSSTTTELVSIESNGNFGIGLENPDYRLHVESTSSGYVAEFDKNNASGTSIIRFTREGAFVGAISESGGTVSYGAFTGSHIGNMNGQVDKGQLVSIRGIVRTLGQEPVYQLELSSIENDPKVLGSYFDVFDDEDGSAGDILVNAVGNGQMWMVDNGQDLNVGDYIITSSIPGHGQLALGELEIEYIVGRVAEDVKWSQVEGLISGKKHKLVHVFYESFEKSNKADLLEKEVQLLKERIERLEAIKTD